MGSGGHKGNKELERIAQGATWERMVLKGKEKLQLQVQLGDRYH